MPARVPGYEYDVFISYRQKDNRNDGWVTDFVSSLKRELESSFNDEISVYFDQNPVDGVLENYDVDGSLSSKLKSLIFIPIISRTYCDPKSYAWKYEFKAFIEQASSDEFGLKVKLRNGNVASRVLPVRIYDLESREVELCEELTGGALRGIDFIFRSAGVNRPLRALEDHPGDNLGKIYYRDQINKLANSIREILLVFNDPESKPVSETGNAKAPKPADKAKSYWLYTALLLLFFIPVAVLLSTKVFKNNEANRSIAVLPFINNSNDAGLDYLINGMCAAISNKLCMIGDMNIPPYSATSLAYGSEMTNKEIARDLRVNYLLVGIVTKSEEKIRIIVNLVDGRTGKMEWSGDYPGSVSSTNYFEIISDIANNVVKSLKIALDPSLEERIDFQPSENAEATGLYLKAMNYAFHGTDYPKIRALLEKAIKLDPGFADAYAELGYWWLHQGGYGGSISREEVFTKATPLISKALEIDSTCVIAHYSNALLHLYYAWNFKIVEQEYKTVKRLAPSNSDNISFFVDYLLASGKSQEAFEIANEVFENDPESAENYILLALTGYFNNQEAIIPDLLAKALSKYPDHENLIVNSIRIYNYLGLYPESINLYKSKYEKHEKEFSIPYFQGHYAIALYKNGKPNESLSILKELLIQSDSTTIGSPLYFAAAIYTTMGQNEVAISLLEKAFDRKEVEMYWLKVEPLFSPLHGDERFENLVKKIGYN